jgi:hypothetical protein
MNGLSAGTRLGPYEVIAKLGEGGPPSLAAAFGRQLRRGLAVAQARIWQ